MGFFLVTFSQCPFRTKEPYVHSFISFTVRSCLHHTAVFQYSLCVCHSLFFTMTSNTVCNVWSEWPIRAQLMSIMWVKNKDVCVMFQSFLVHGAFLSSGIKRLYQTSLSVLLQSFSRHFLLWRLLWSCRLALLEGWDPLFFIDLSWHIHLRYKTVPCHDDNYCRHSQKAPLVAKCTTRIELLLTCQSNVHISVMQTAYLYHGLF